MLSGGRFCLMTLTTEGMISPAFSMMTVSPRRMSLRWISSSLWSVARATVDPEMNTGSSSATGVRTPVRPTWMVMRRSFVSICSGQNLYAHAHFGNLDVAPSWVWSESWFTLMTAPSVA